MLTNKESRIFHCERGYKPCYCTEPLLVRVDGMNREYRQMHDYTRLDVTDDTTPQDIVAPTWEEHEQWAAEFLGIDECCGDF